VYYDSLEDKLGILTANTTTPYALSFINLAETGPVLIEIPDEELRGSVSDMWQIALSILPKPGKYLFVAPEMEIPQVDDAEVVQSPTNSILFGVRLMSEDPQRQNDILNKILICPWEKRDNPEPMRIVRVDGKRWQGWQPRGLEYWERLSAIINQEPVQEHDRMFMAMLKPLGIEKGKPFTPDDRQKKILTDASLVGEAMAKANAFSKRFESAHYLDGSHWHFATVAFPDQRAKYYDQLDERAAWFYEAVTNDPRMQTSTPGVGQVYLGAYKDAEGNWFDGGKDYRLHVPAEVPAKAFWSITVYNVGTRTLIDNGQGIADRSSRMNLDYNEDGSVDIYIGPNPPKGKKNNWIPTIPGKAWFAYFRFFSPAKPFFDRTWVLPDVELSYNLELLKPL
jgi:hypothetical protein